MSQSASDVTLRGQLETILIIKGENGKVLNQGMTGDGRIVVEREGKEMEKAWMRILIWVSQGTLARGEESCGLGLLGAARWRRWEVVCRGEGESRMA